MAKDASTLDDVRQALLDRIAKDVEAKVSGEHIKALSEAYAVLASLK